MNNGNPILMRKIICTTALISAGICIADSGYPRPMLFRENFPKLLPQYDHIQLMVSDLHTDKRKFCDAEFKQKHPDALVLVQFNNEPTGIWGTWEMLPKQRLEDLRWLEPAIRDSNRLLDLFNHNVHPLMDFPGHWVYEAGSKTKNTIPADKQTITIQVENITPFLPLEHRLSKNVAKNHPEIPNALLKDIVIYPLNPNGTPDWLNADMGSVTAIDQAAKTVTVRRWKNSSNWHAFKTGAVMAPNAVSVTYDNTGTARNFPPDLRDQITEAAVMKPFLPNLTKHCPVDPRTGLTAVETMAKHYIAMKRAHYPNVDGFVFDVSSGTHTPSHRVSERIDADNDGAIDNFQFDGVLTWPLGIRDFCSLLREGKPGAFEGLGKNLLLISDSNFNEDQRLFGVFNGGEYEHSFTLFFPPYNFMYSSNLDRWLLWDRIGRKPNISYVHNKYADQAYHGGDVKDLHRPATLAHYRLDMATACMGSGYVGKTVLRKTHGSSNPDEVNYPGLVEERKEYGGMLPKIYDEYHAGRGQYGWLGLPKAAPVRITSSWSEPIYHFSADTPLPSAKVSKPWKISTPARTQTGFTFQCLETGLWRELKDSFSASVILPLPDIKLEQNGEYVVSFNISGSSAYSRHGEAYRNIPKNLRLRFATDQQASANSKSVEELDTNVAQLLGGGNSGGGYMQEVLVFPEERNVVITLIAGADGPATLEIGTSEEPGSYEITDLTIRKGCADVLAREFDNGLVLANGSAFTDADIDIPSLFPNSTFKRIKGKQDPVHNDGSLAETITLKQGDGIFLERIQ